MVSVPFGLGNGVVRLFSSLKRTALSRTESFHKREYATLIPNHLVRGKRLNHTIQYEEAYNLVPRLLDQIAESNPDTYINKLKSKYADGGPNCFILD